MTTSMKLMHLFKLLSRPKFLFGNERNHRYVFFLLEVFNNSIQYQYEGTQTALSIKVQLTAYLLIQLKRKLSLDLRNDTKQGCLFPPSFD